MVGQTRCFSCDFNTSLGNVQFLVHCIWHTMCTSSLYLVLPKPVFLFFRRLHSYNQMICAICLAVRFTNWAAYMSKMTKDSIIYCMEMSIKIEFIIQSSFQILLWEFLWKMPDSFYALQKPVDVWVLILAHICIYHMSMALVTIISTLLPYFKSDPYVSFPL